MNAEFTMIGVDPVVPTLVDMPDLPRPESMADLMNRAHQGVALGPMIEDHVRRLQIEPNNAALMMNLALVLQFYLRRDEAMAFQRRALGYSRAYEHPAPRGRGLRVLCLVAPGDLGMNMPIELMLRGRNVTLIKYYLLPGEPLPAQLPDHDLAIVGISEYDETRQTLKRLAEVWDRWPRPTLNHPRRLLQLSRDTVARLLAGAPGLAVPQSVRIDRRGLERVHLVNPFADGPFPFIARPLGSHGGKGLGLIEDPDALARYLTESLAEEFYVARYVDYRSEDGRFRKYRIAFIGGKPHLAHMAVGDHWIVHYWNAGMADDVSRRIEEAQAFQTFGTAFARRHRRALGAISDRLGLEFVVIDCAETRDGELLLFEADNAGAVHDLDPPEIFPYKRKYMRRVFDAFSAMLRRTARSNARHA